MELYVILQRLENKIPIFGRGVLAMPGSKKQTVPVNTPITAGGISVNPGDIIVADEEGIAVIPKDRAEEIYQECKEKVKKKQLLVLKNGHRHKKKTLTVFYE